MLFLNLARTPLRICATQCSRSVASTHVISVRGQCPEAAVTSIFLTALGGTGFATIRLQRQVLMAKPEKKDLVIILVCSRLNHSDFVKTLFVKITIHLYMFVQILQLSVQFQNFSNH